MAAWTVVGLRLETWERFAEIAEATTPRGAEDLITLTCEQAGAPIAVCAVIEGAHPSADDYATWVLPDATTQDEVDQARMNGGYTLWAPDRDTSPARRGFFGRRS